MAIRPGPKSLLPWTCSLFAIHNTCCADILPTALPIPTRSSMPRLHSLHPPTPVHSILSICIKCCHFVINYHTFVFYLKTDKHTKDLNVFTLFPVFSSFSAPLTAVLAIVSYLQIQGRNYYELSLNLATEIASFFPLKDHGKCFDDLYVAVLYRYHFFPLIGIHTNIGFEALKESSLDTFI